MKEKYLRLKSTHPTAKKFDKLCQMADKLGISIEVYSHRMFLTDHDHENTVFYIDDIEDAAGGPGDGSFTSFPPTTEYKITYEDPVHKVADGEG